jgi:hypothetical protein
MMSKRVAFNSHTYRSNALPVFFSLSFDLPTLFPLKMFAALFIASELQRRSQVSLPLHRLTKYLKSLFNYQHYSSEDFIQKP